MIYFPCIYFLILTIVWWKKHQMFDVCVYMSLLYTLTSLLAIIIVHFDMLGAGGILFDESDAKFGFIPTIAYCGLLTLSLLPFSLIYGKDLKQINPTYNILLIGLSLFLIGIALINLYLVADSTAEILSGDLSTIRNDHYEGIKSPAQVKAESMPAIIKFLYYFNDSTILAIPLLFYFICFNRKPWWFNLALFLTSLSMPVVGIQMADRTELVFYSLMFIFCLIFFRPFLSKKIKKLIVAIGLPTTLLFVVYFIAVSDARFSDREGGAFTSGIQYAGQGYLNFCFFWENAKSDLISAERELPWFHHYVLKVDSDTERRAVRSGQQGFYISVFASFLGDLLLDLTLLGTVVWVMFYFLTVFLVIKKSHREQLDIGEVLLTFFLAAIPVFGIFYYRYYSFHATYCLMLASVIYIFTRLKYKLQS